MNHLYPISLCLGLLLTGCVLESSLPGEGDEPVPVPEEEKIAVSFSSTIDLETKAGSEAETKAESTTLADGVQVTVHAYEQSGIATPSAAAVVSRNYAQKVSGGSANLEVTGGDGGMFVAAGNYTFFALSVNADAAPPVLISFSETGQLHNNTDYIYCATHAAITSQPGVAQNVPLAFKRLSTRIAIQIVSDSNGDDKATAATAPIIRFAATDSTGSKITLGASSVITSGNPVIDTHKYTEITSAGDITNGFTAVYTMLPMQANQTIPVTITFPSITFNGLVQTDKVYTLTIPTSGTGLTSGNQYNYKVNITGNDIIFQGVSVSPWTGKDGSLPNEDVTEDW